MPGRCTRCKSSTVEIDYVIQQHGVSIFSPRLKGGERFIAFDKPLEFKDKAFLRLRARNKVLNLPIQRSDISRIAGENSSKLETVQETLESETDEKKKLPEETGEKKNIPEFGEIFN